MGGNIEVMIRTLQTLGSPIAISSFTDTFAGMPRPDATDDVGVNNELRRIWDIHRTDADGDAGSDRMRAGIDLVRQIVEPLGYPRSGLISSRAWSMTRSPQLCRQIALLQFDTDFYSSMKHELVHLYPRLASGGVLIIGDYGAMPGRRAVTNIEPSISCVGSSPASMRMCGSW